MFPYGGLQPFGQPVLELILKLLWEVEQRKLTIVFSPWLCA
jgi:hypothetical protein